MANKKKEGKTTTGMNLEIDNKLHYGIHSRVLKERSKGSKTTLKETVLLCIELGFKQLKKEDKNG